MKLPRTLLLVLCAVVLAGLRIAGIKHPAFQAVAHLYVGFLFGAWADSRAHGNSDRGCFWLAIALSVVELICFLTFRHASM